MPAPQDRLPGPWRGLLTAAGSRSPLARPDDRGVSEGDTDLQNAGAALDALMLSGFEDA